MEEYLSIVGDRSLVGTARVSGAKNSALPLLFATLLTPEECVLSNVPDLDDIAVTLRLLGSLGAKSKFQGNQVRITTPTIGSNQAPYALVKALRASFWALGPLLARTGSARVSLPGGDAIGTRPVDLHLSGLTKMGADVRMQQGEVVATAPGGLYPAKIRFDFPSVGATHHLMMTASLVPGETVLQGAAREPEVVELAAFLSAMGAEIEGAGESTIHIRGQKELHGAAARVIGDRIEAATYLIGGAVTKGDVTVTGIEADAVNATLQVLGEAGCQVQILPDGVRVASAARLKAVSFETAPYPGLATDVQPLLMAAMTKAQGRSRVKETIFENRFGHVAEYRRLGAQIGLEGRKAEVNGVETLSGAPVDAGDIRAAAGLVLMGLMAEGETQIYEIYHLDRGYEGLVDKLRGLGANISRIPFYDQREVILGC